MARATWTLMGLAAAALLLGLAGQAHAVLIAGDQFMIGTEPDTGEYNATDLAGNTPQNPAIPGFSGSWQNGTQVTGTWDASDGSLQQASGNGAGGRVTFNGYGSDIRRVYRNVNDPPSSGVYYINALLRLDTAGDLTGLNVGGFYRNNVTSDSQFFDSYNARDQEGLGFGFQGDGSQIDLVLRHRYDPDPAPGNQGQRMLVDTLVPNIQAGTTYRVVAKLEMNAEPNGTTGNDRVSIWVNPADFTAETLAGPPTVQLVDYSLSNTAFLDRLEFASNSFGNQVSYDEMRLATTWRDAAALLYHNSFAGAQGTQPPGFVAHTWSGMVSRNDGSSEYEQRRVSGDGVALAAYTDADVVDRGAWRDVTAQALFRYSGGGNNRNGFILRAQGITDASDTTQDFYHVRESGGNVELYRVNNGSFTLLDQMAIPGGAYGTTEHLVQVSIENIPNPHNDHVLVRAIGYSGTTEASGVKYEFEFTDTSTSAITRAGGVGFRSYNTSGASSRSTYDDLRVYADNARLLWYDDYSDGTAPRMQVFGKSVTTSNKTYNFNPSGGTGIATIDFDAMTSQDAWEDVAVSATMRLDSAATTYSGLVCRETGVAGATGSGDLYMYRISEPNSRAELYRANNGSFTLLDAEPLTAAQFPNHTDIFIQMFADTLGSAVYLRGLLSLDPDLSDAFGVIEYLDFSPNRILGPGSAGFRTVGGGNVNFDNFTVQTFQVPEPATLALLGLGGLLALRRRRRA